jgi:hypothetical protein
MHLAAVMVLLLAGGCGQPAQKTALVREPPEASLDEQAQDVREGRRDMIWVDAAVVRDGDLAALADLDGKLRRIVFSKSEITDDGLAAICQLGELQQLRLSSPRVTDTGMAHVAALSRLRFLHLLDMPITDAGLDQLHGLKTLESLYLDHTKVTDEGMARLFKALPNVHVHIDDHHHRLDPHLKEYDE